MMEKKLASNHSHHQFKNTETGKEANNEKKIMTYFNSDQVLRQMIFTGDKKVRDLLPSQQSNN